MKIGLDLKTQAINEYKPQMEISKNKSDIKSNSAVVDIKGSVYDNNAYANHKKSIDEIMSDAGVCDVKTARNFMTIVSNTMSGKDYEKMLEDGFDPSEMDYEDTVTILDHIKAAMLKSGEVVEGYNDDLSGEVLRETTGSSIDIDDIKQAMEEADIPATKDNIRKISEALEMMASVDFLPEGTIKYMVENDLEPTIGNIYTSRYSAMDDGSRQSRGYYAQDTMGYYAKKADEIDWEGIKPQIEKNIREMDLPEKDEEIILEDAKWLIDKGIPVTEEKLTELENTRLLQFPLADEKVMQAGIQAISEGKDVRDANLIKDNKSIYSKAYEQREAIINSSINREEARLQLSIDANIRLLKKGISLDTKPVEEVIEALKKEEAELRKAFLGESDNIEEADKKVESYRQTRQIVEEIPRLPVSTIGLVLKEKDSFTLSDIHTTGVDVREQMLNASMRYEEMGTEIRKDLGDSITKAFRNVDDILRDIGMETSKENERAVRILGYNSMKINEEEVKRVALADAKIQNVINSLTPAKTLSLIREGINPIGMDIDELAETINKLETDVKDDIKKYSKFLYKLEQNKEITAEEKDSFIGIYRMINNLEKTDYASVGRLLESGMDITFGNLLTAMRSSKKSFNEKIDDNFGLLEEKINKGVSIIEQIEAAFVSKISEDVNEELERKYKEEQMLNLKEASEVSEEVLEELINNKINVTPDNIVAAAQFANEPNTLFALVKAYSKRVDNKNNQADEKNEEKLERAIEEFPSSISGEKSAKEGYKTLMNTMSDILSEMVDTAADTSIDLARIGLMYKQISLAVNYSTEENYHIPANIDGRLTDINIKLVHGVDAGMVRATMELEDIGKLEAQIRLNADNELSAVLISENMVGKDFLRAISESFIDDITGKGMAAEDIRYIVGKPGSGSKYLSENVDNNNEAVETKNLYSVARSFIEAVSNK